MFLTSSPNGGDLIRSLLQRILASPQFGTPIYHFRAEWTDNTAFNSANTADYLANDPGQDATGIRFVAVSGNPLRGVFCRAPNRPFQDKGGIYYTAQHELYLLRDPGDVYRLDDRKPKRQDKFVIFNRDYYAIGPATPCQLGETIAAWKIELHTERYPVP